jgi:acyl-CoA hydrolase
MQTKKPQDTFVIMSELVLPNDTNTLGNLMGGKLMHWMDIAAAISSQKHCNCPVVTASVDNVSFTQPIRLGNLLTIEAKLTRSFNTSMEVYLRVWGEDLTAQYKYISNEAYMTFVALDPHGKPRKVPELIPDTELEHKMYDGALRRRQLRLILAGKMKTEDAGELRALFVK